MCDFYEMLFFLGGLGAVFMTMAVPFFYMAQEEKTKSAWILPGAFGVMAVVGFILLTVNNCETGRECVDCCLVGL